MPCWSQACAAEPGPYAPPRAQTATSGPRNQSSVTFLRSEAKCQSPVHEQIDVVLELVGNAEIPHRQRHEILVRRLEVIGDAHNRLPEVELFGRGWLPHKESMRERFSTAPRMSI